MDIEPTPADLTQLSKGRNGKMVPIEDDVIGVARDLQKIDPRLKLRYSEPGEYYVVYTKEEFSDGSVKEEMVGTYQELDERIVRRIRKIASPDYNFAAELERMERENDNEYRRKKYDRVGELAEKLAFALRKDTGNDKHRAFVSEEMKDKI